MKLEHDELTLEKCKDSGLALVLLCLICHQVWKIQLLSVLGIVFLVAAMTYPLVFKPFARLWFGLSARLGAVMSSVVLTLLFFGVVLPVGLLRRMLGKDSMRVTSWKKGSVSVFRVRNHRFEAKDLEHPY